MSNFYQDVVKHDSRFKSIHPCKDMALLEPTFRAKVVTILGEAKAMGVDLRVTETFRSQARQHYVYEQGFSRLRQVGCHGYGVAVDFGVYINGQYEDNGHPHYEFLAPMAKKHGLISGINWGHDHKGSFVDWGHMQVPAVFRQRELFSGTWYPDEKYDPYADMKAHGVS